MSQQSPTTKQLSSPSVPDGLLDHVLSRLSEERRLARVRRKLSLVSSVFCGALVAFFWVWQKLVTDLGSSGSGDFFGLWLSDFALAARHGRELTMSIVESLPLFSITLFLVSLCALFVLLKFIVLYINASREVRVHVVH
jgi:hypothetical protein